MIDISFHNDSISSFLKGIDICMSFNVVLFFLIEKLTSLKSTANEWTLTEEDEEEEGASL